MKLNTKFSRFVKVQNKGILSKITFKLLIPFNSLYYALKKEIIHKILIRYPTYGMKLHALHIITWWDPIRFSTIALALNTIKKEKILGSLAELGVFRGDSSKIIHLLAPEKKLYLFDTFESFPLKYIEKKTEIDRFKGTNIEILKKNLGDLNNIVIKKGVFPDTTKGLENERFSFVSIDVDLYQSTLKGLEFFYEKVEKGGYIFVHDYNKPNESNAGAFRAVNEFIQNKPEKIVELPDINGSIIIRKQ